MKTTEFLRVFKRVKRDLRELASRVAFSRMVIQNIKEIIPSNWVLSPDNWYGDITISPVEDSVVTADVFDKFVTKIAKALQCEPSIYITESRMRATFSIYRRESFGAVWHDYACGVSIAVVTGNTEKCEITYKRKMQKVPVLTGYCKELSEKHYLEKVNR